MHSSRSRIRENYDELHGHLDQVDPPYAPIEYANSTRTNCLVRTLADSTHESRQSEPWLIGLIG